VIVMSGIGFSGFKFCFKLCDFGGGNREVAGKVGASRVSLREKSCEFICCGCEAGFLLCHQ
jgi:hypothetical protein